MSPIKTYHYIKLAIFCLLVSSGNLYSQSKKIDNTYLSPDYKSALKLLESEPEQSLKMVEQLLSTKDAKNSAAHHADLLFLKARTYFKLEKKQLAVNTSEEALELYKALNDKKAIINTHLFISETLIDAGRAEKAQPYLQKALQVATEIEDQFMILEAHLKFCRYYNILGDFESSLKTTIAAKDIAETINSDTIQDQRIIIYNSLGIIYESNNEDDKAISYYLKGIETATAAKNLDLLSQIHSNIAISYHKNEKTEKAEFHYKKGLEVSLELGTQSSIINAQSYLGDFYLLEKKYSKAIPFLKKTIDHYKKSDEIGEMAYSLGSLGVAELASQNYSIGLKHLKEADEIIASTEMETYKIALYDLMAYSCYENGFFKEAFDFYEKHIAVKEKIHNERNQNKILELSTQFETKEKEKEIAALKNEKIARDKMFYLSCLVGLLLCLLIGILIYAYKLILKRNKALNIAKDAAEQLAKAKTEFLATMSHEIRTPMNGVIGMANILADENPRPDQKENLEILRFSADNLLHLINDILDLAKIDSGKIVLEQKNFDLQNHFQKLFTIFKTANDKTAVELKLDLQLDDLNHQVIGDTLRLNQVVTNLINNAIKFTSEGSVCLKISNLNHTPERAKIKFEIIDTGIGISKENQKSIFEKYQQAENETSRLYGGTGLGLNIAKEIIELHGGELKLQSEIGKGSNFYFEIDFPISKTKTQSLNQSKIALKTPDLAGMKILLAEDNKVNQMVAKRLLNKWKVNLTIAEDGVAAVESFKTNDFDLILMDIQMPNMDGFEATKIIRKLPNGKLPIYSMSASTFSSSYGIENKNLLDGHIGKPFNPDELFALLSNHFPKKNIVEAQNLSSN